MATFEELFKIHSNSSLINRITVAIADVATDVLGEQQMMERRVWAQEAIINPDPQALEFVWAFLIASQNETQSDILNSTDEVIKAAIELAVDNRFGAGQGPGPP